MKFSLIWNSHTYEASSEDRTCLMRLCFSLLRPRYPISQRFFFLQVLLLRMCCGEIDSLFFGGVALSWHINLHGLSNAKVILVEEQLWHYLKLSWKGIGGFLISFSESIRLKVAQYDIAVYQVSQLGEGFSKLGWFLMSCQTFWVILCLEVRGSCWLWVHIYIPCLVVSKEFFVHSSIGYEDDQER